MELLFRSPYLLFASNYQFMATQNKHPMGGGRNLKSGPQRRSEGGQLDQHNVAPRAPARKLFWAARESIVARETFVWVGAQTLARRVAVQKGSIDSFGVGRVVVSAADRT